MVASLSDQNFLAQDPTFIGRVKEGLAAACGSIVNEVPTGLTGAIPIQLHSSRSRQAAGILNVIDSGSTNWPQRFAIAVATDANVISDATQGGTVVLTAGNAAAQAALVTDAHITAAISSQFNSFLTLT